MRERSSSAGFTLIELLVTMTVTGIMLAIGVPAFTNMIASGKLSAQVDELAGMLNYARSMALSQNSPVQFCPVGAVGSAVCGANWSLGWMVVTAPTAAAIAAGANPTLLQTHAIPAPITLAVSAAVVAPAWITFDPHGLTTTTANFALCDSRGAPYARTALLNSTGSVQTARQGMAAWNGAATGGATCTAP